MIGNSWEWVDWWAGQGPDDSHTESSPTYAQDGLWNVDAAQGQGNSAVGFPAAALRGGNLNGGVEAGASTMFLADGPSDWSNDVGARCCIGGH